MYESRDKIREALAGTGIKFSKVAEKGGVAPQTLWSAFKDGTNNLNIVEAIRWGLQIHGDSVDLDSLSPMWPKEPSKPAKKEEAPDA